MPFTLGIIAGLVFVAVGALVALNPERTFAVRHVLFLREMPALNAFGTLVYRIIGLGITGLGLVVLWASLQA